MTTPNQDALKVIVRRPPEGFALVDIAGIHIGEIWKEKRCWVWRMSTHISRRPSSYQPAGTSRSETIRSLLHDVLVYPIPGKEIASWMVRNGLGVYRLRDPERQATTFIPDKKKIARLISKVTR